MKYKIYIKPFNYLQSLISFSVLSMVIFPSRGCHCDSKPFVRQRYI